MVGCTATCRRLHTLSQVAAVAHAEGPALLPVTAVGFLCLVVLQVWCLCLSLGQAGSAVCRCCKGSGLGALEECCLALDLNWERMPSFQVWRVWLFMSQQCHWQWCTWRAEPGVPYTAIHTCSAPCAAPDTCPKPHLQGCVGSFLSSVQNLWPLS